jgi:hypothetical protein
MVQWARQHEVLPEAYLYGMSNVLGYSKNRSAFLNGVVSQDGGWRWFFPYAALVKTTLPTILLGIVGVVIVARRLRARDEPESAAFAPYDLVPLAVLVAWYWIFAIQSSLNIGYRHMLPASAAMLVLVGAAGLPLANAYRAMRTTGRITQAA